MSFDVNVRTPKLTALVGLGTSQTHSGEEVASAVGKRFQALKAFCSRVRPQAPQGSRLEASRDFRAGARVLRGGGRSPLELTPMRRAASQPPVRAANPGPSLAHGGSPVPAPQTGVAPNTTAVPLKSFDETFASRTETRDKLNASFEALIELHAGSKQDLGLAERLGGRTRAGDRSDLVKAKVDLAIKIEKAIADVDKDIKADLAKLETLRRDLVGRLVATEFPGLAGCVDGGTAPDDLRQAFDQVIDKLLTLKTSGSDVALRQALRIVGSAFGTIHADSEAVGDDAPVASEKKANALEMLGAAIGVLADGETGVLTSQLIGRSPDFDKTLLAMVVKSAEKTAVAHYEAMNRKPTPPKQPTPEEFRNARPQNSGPARPQSSQLKTFKQAEARYHAKLLRHYGELSKWQNAHAGGLAAAAVNGKAVAERRFEITKANKQLASLIGVRHGPQLGSHLGHRLGTGDKNRAFGSLDGIRKDAQFVRALTSFGAMGSMKDVVLLVARISAQELQIIKDEQSILGLHMENTPQGRTPISLSHLEIQGSNPFYHLGLTDGKLEKLGLSTSDRKDLSEQIVKLSKGGTGSLAELNDGIARLNALRRGVFEDRAMQGITHRFVGESTQAQGRRLLNDLLSDAFLAGTADKSQLKAGGVSLAFDDSTEAAKKDPVLPAARNTDVVAGMKTRWDAAFNTLTMDDRAALALGTVEFKRFERELIEADGRRAAVNERFFAARNRLETECSEAKPGEPPTLDLDLNPFEPRGLRSAKVVLTVIEAHERAQALPPGPARDAAVRTREDALETLKGYDTRAMRRPWHGKLAAALGLGKTPDLDSLLKLKQAAEDIRFIREDAGAEKAPIFAVMTDRADGLDLVSLHRETAYSDLSALATQMTRTAVLACWPRDGKEFEQRSGEQGGYVERAYNPVEHRAAIETLLTTWGIDTNLFGPEIDGVLNTAVNADEIAKWKSEATFSQDAQAVLHPKRSFGHRMRDLRNDPAGELKAAAKSARDYVINKKPMNEETKRDVMALVAALQPDEKWSAKRALRITGDTNDVPVDPYAIVNLRAKLGVSFLAEFKVELGSDGYKLTARRGADGKASLGVTVGQKWSADWGGGAGVSAGLTGEASGGRVSGVTGTFPANEAGRKALLAMIEKIANSEPLTAVDMATFGDHAFSYENNVKVSVALKAKAFAEVTNKPLEHAGDSQFDAKTKIGIGASAEASSGVSWQGKLGGARSLNEVTRTREQEFAHTDTVTVGAYAKFLNPITSVIGLGMDAVGAQQSADRTFGKEAKYDAVGGQGQTDLLGVSATMSLTYTKKTKHILTGDGFYRKGEITRQTNVTTALGAVGTVGDNDLPKLLEQDDAFRHGFAGMMQRTSKGDVLSVVYAAKPAAIETANALLEEANALRNQGHNGFASDLEAKAAAIMDDRANYQASKLILLHFKSDTQDAGIVGSKYLTVDTSTTGKLEHPVLTLKVPGA